VWEVNHRKQRVILFAVADCTGHGVPGAFMSIVGHNGLTLAVRDYRLVSPASILTFLNSYVFDTLHHERESGFMKNGMDIGLMAYYTQEQRIDYSGAFIPLYHVTAGVLHEIPGDKIVIGRKEGSIINGSGFSNHTISLTEGDCVYMATDGYADQFGGDCRTKYKNRQLRNLLKQVSTESVAKQKEIILSTHKDWKGNFMQIDDILVFGMRVVPSPGKQASPKGQVNFELLGKDLVLVTPTNC
jgi:serine phosphatase RsbU (regulator of sigma subunit)